MAEAVAVADTAAADATDGEQGNSFEAVAAADAEYRALEIAKGVDEGQEEAALRSLFEGPSAGLLEAACQTLPASVAWSFESMRDAWRRLEADERSVGARVRAVIETLDAPHLRPSSIEERLKNGTTAACFGCVSLFNNLRNDAE